MGHHQAGLANIADDAVINGLHSPGPKWPTAGSIANQNDWSLELSLLAFFGVGPPVTGAGDRKIR